MNIQGELMVIALSCLDGLPLFDVVLTSVSLGKTPKTKTLWKTWDKWYLVKD